MLGQVTVAVIFFSFLLDQRRPPSSPKYGQKHMDHILQLTEAEGKRLRPDKYDWQEGGDSVPDGWKIRLLDN
jgi:hypothetical protein